MLRLGIIGLPLSGKTTVFHALTAGQLPRTESVGRGQELHVAVVKVPDARLERLNELFRPRRWTPAEMEYVDFPAAGLGGRERGEAAWIGTLRTMDSLLYVTRSFDDASVPHEGQIDPLVDAEKVLVELAISDLAVVERRLRRLEADLRRTRAGERAPIEREISLFSALAERLESGTPVRDADLAPEEELAIRGFQLLTAKPALILVNLDESQVPKTDDVEAAIRAAYPHRASAIGSLAAKVEAELAELEPEDRQLFMRELGIRESGAGRVIRLSYALNGLISFFTGGDEEVRAWAAPLGTTAPQAAATVHTDMERGFIRAEVITFEDFSRVGSMAEARRQGLLRQEGRDYVVQDGDVLHVLFSR